MMYFTRIRAAGFACSLTIAAGASAAGPLLKLDSQQKAASAIIATSLGPQIEGQLNVITAAALEYSTLAMRALVASTTPAALAQVSGGMTLPCRGGGSFVARNTTAATRVVDIEFVNCLPYRFISETANGPLRLTLISNSFVSEQIAGIRLGTRDRDFVVTDTPPSPENSPASTTNHNLTMLGSLAVPRNQQADGVPAKSFYELNGFMSQRNRYENSGPEVYEGTLRNTAEHVLVSTAIAADNDFFLYDQDVTFLWGAFASHSGELRREYDWRYEVTGLRLRWIIDYEAWTNTRTLDGAIRFSGPSQTGQECLNGAYLFETRTPLHYPDANSSILDAGELVINRDVNMRVYAPGAVPPGLPTPSLGMLLNVNVRGVGTFNLDTNALNGEAMWALSECPYR